MTINIDTISGHVGGGGDWAFTANIDAEAINDGEDLPGPTLLFTSSASEPDDLNITRSPGVDQNGNIYYILGESE